MELSSYYPLRPLNSRLRRTTTPEPSSEQFLIKDADLSRPSPTESARDSAEPYSRFHAPLPPQRSRRGSLTNWLPPWRTIRLRLEVACLPLAAIAYLAFCYIVHARVVPLHFVGTEHLTTIKGGITSISVIIISIALYPIYNMVSRLKSEEFFRVLASRSQGVPLETINHISNPSFGNIDAMIAMCKYRFSNYYMLGFTAWLLTWVVATLAPGVLTINSVLTDGELMAFAIGAVTPQSVLNGTYPATPGFNASLNSDAAASIAWAEMELGAQYSFGVANTSHWQSEYTAFIVPVPLCLSATTTARWLTDVIGIHPKCSWAATNLTSTVQLPFNSTGADIGQDIAVAYLPDFDLDVSIGTLPIGDAQFATVQNPTLYVTNHTTQAPAIDGSTVFLLGQCLSGCLPGYPVNLTLDLTSLNTTFTVALTDQTWTMAFLTCLPNITIETREVRNDGRGILEVQPLPAGSKLKRQGNLNTVQTTAMFSIATMSLSQKAGPVSGSQLQYSSLGSYVQGDVLFGKAQFEGLPGIDAQYGTLATIKPAPIENITQGYTQIIQSVAKSYLAGYLGIAYVPGRISIYEIVFAASMPYLAITTVVFVLLIAIIFVSHFRSGKGIEFTLVNVAAAVHGSELPEQFAQIKAEEIAAVRGDADMEREAEAESATATVTDTFLVNRVGHNVPDAHQHVLEVWGDRRIFMQRRWDGSPVLHMR